MVGSCARNCLYRYDLIERLVVLSTEDEVFCDVQVGLVPGNGQVLMVERGIIMKDVLSLAIESEMRFKRGKRKQNA